MYESAMHMPGLMRQRAMRGVAAVEFALLLGPMLLLVFGITEYGRALFQYNTLAKAARDSARLLSQHSPSDVGYPAAEARCLAVFGNSTCTAPALVPGLTTSMVQICDREACPGPGYANVPTSSGTINLVEVRISGFVFNSLVPFVTNGNTLNFGDIRVTMRQVL